MTEVPFPVRFVSNTEISLQFLKLGQVASHTHPQLKLQTITRGTDEASC